MDVREYQVVPLSIRSVEWDLTVVASSLRAIVQMSPRMNVLLWLIDNIANVVTCGDCATSAL
jgi:hypothetical protein